MACLRCSLRSRSFDSKIFLRIRALRFLRRAVGDGGGVDSGGPVGAADIAPSRCGDGKSLTRVMLSVRRSSGSGNVYGLSLIMRPSLKQSSNQCGKTILHLSCFSCARRHLSLSSPIVTMCVTSLLSAPLYCPPNAITPAMIASLSPSGRSAQVSTTLWKNWLGSGLCWRGCACLFLFALERTHDGLMMCMPCSRAALY